MIRRTVLALTALAVVGGVSGTALASNAPATPEERHYVCLLGNESPGAATQGLCVWIPTN